MSRNPEYKFVPTSSEEYLEELIAKYKEMTGRSLNPADPDRLFLSWMANIIVSEKINQNYIGNQNIPSRAEGENLDYLGNYIYFTEREGARPSTCTMCFYFSIPVPEVVVIPEGTRVTDKQATLVWATASEVIAMPGAESIEVEVICETGGTAGNGYTAGQIDRLVDVDNVLYCSSCENKDTTSGGSDVESDDEYYTRMCRSLDALSVAGPSGAYEYHAKKVSDDISDVKAVRPRRTRSVTLDIYTAYDGTKSAFIGGDGLLESSLTVDGAEIDADYVYSYNNGLLKIDIIPSGRLISASRINVNIDEDMACRVQIYCLNKDGSIAGDGLKGKVLSACSSKSVRPMTDYVTVDDAEAVPYDIDFDYYISNDAEYSYAQIRDNVMLAVNEYITWQGGKFGRDINPSYLYRLLMETGVKRVTIRSPAHLKTRDGKDGKAPQYAVFSGNVNESCKFGGYEDE